MSTSTTSTDKPTTEQAKEQVQEGAEQTKQQAQSFAETAQKTATDAISTAGGILGNAVTTAGQAIGSASRYVLQWIEDSVASYLDPYFLERCAWPSLRFLVHRHALIHVPIALQICG